MHIVLAPAWDVVELLCLYPVDVLLHGNANTSWVCRTHDASPDQVALAQSVQRRRHPFELQCKCNRSLHAKQSLAKTTSFIIPTG